MNESDVNPQPVMQPPTVYHTRTFHDLNDRTWIVREEPLPSYDRRSGTCLIFERSDVVRRVRNFPAHWFDLSDAELSMVCESI